MIKQDTLENRAKIVYLGIGSNLGNKKINIEKAKFQIEKNGIKIEACSSFYETDSWPNKNFPKFFNICLLYTSPSPRDKRQSRMPSSA